ncbi:MAG: LexA family transcriptional regulator [Oceanibaculum nanhaiense]|jgi:phage repressor protein C with HTH and peptisase S24 domain|uniref:XRE family transcriptional regulator n=1 Tax=Oceanibaculum nanhaiense TaxID=1909734 RepID=UPI0025A462A2|nr:LexA family transcriptional regulator [Oceanibaculum nanhaiense]MDM7947086.1 LexA family transcriptional regulator [Oceanibaculum nanhaiense]
MRYTMADRLRARSRQLGMTAGRVAELAGINRSFVYDIMRGRSENPNLEKLDQVAQTLNVERNWLLHGIGDVDGESPIMEDPMEAFVSIPSVEVTASMGGGNLITDEVENGEPYNFQRSWIVHDLKADPANLRIMHVEGDSMMPTLNSGDVVLVDLSRKSPTPPGIFVLFDGMGLVAKRLENIPNNDPPKVRVISDNTFYSPYERTADEVSIIGRIRWFAREI